MGHVVLLGDSIFDNARYVPGRPSVIEQLRRALPRGWQASLLAVDGHTTKDVPVQLRSLPSDATHLVVSVGGNDALAESTVLGEAARTVGEALAIFQRVQTRFREAYGAMLRAVGACAKPAAACTVYDAIPGLGPADQAALAGFNAVILREAFAAGLPIIDLRLVCDQPVDYSPISPIEPSVLGGAKITRVIVEVVTTHDFGCGRSTIYF
jgi:hypothetical protein